MGIGPAPPHDPALPGEDRRRGHEKRRPPAAREERSGQGEEGSIGPAEAGTWGAPAQDLELMTEHDDLDVLLDAAQTMDPKKLEDTSDQAVEEGEGHGRRDSLRHPAWSSQRSSLCIPQVLTGHQPRGGGQHMQKVDLCPHSER